MKLGIIGMGNMAGAILAGLLKKEVIAADEIIVSRRSKEELNKIHEKFGVHISTDNKEVAKKAEILMLAVKPQFMEEVIEEIRGEIRKEQLIITIAAGKMISWYEERFQKKIKLVRAMPNTPALVLEGCTGYCSNDEVGKEEKETAKSIFESCGTSYEIPEKLMDAYGAVAGCGPAFLFLFMEAMADGAVYHGIPRKTAYEIASQTVLGSGKLMLETGRHPGELKDMVCSPGGTTITGIKALEENGVRAAVMNCITSCVEKSTKL